MLVSHCKEDMLLFQMVSYTPKEKNTTEDLFYADGSHLQFKGWTSIENRGISRVEEVWGKGI